MARKLSALALLAVFGCTCLAAAAEGGGPTDADVSLRAESIRTWLQDRTRVFILKGDARISSGESRLTGNAMVVWFDESAAARTRRIWLRIYSESRGAAGITDLSSSGRLVVDDRALVAFGAPAHSPLLARAAAALRAEITAPTEGEEAVEKAPTAGYRPPELEETPGRETRGKLEEYAARGPVKIEYAAIHPSGLDFSAEEGLWIITGGVEITFDVYSMRAENIVVWPKEGDSGQIEQFQAYAEGDVTFTTPSARLEATRIFYDYRANRATLLDARAYTRLENENLPLVLKAKQVRAFSDRSLEARQAYVTTCEFGRPHYRLAFDKVNVTASTDREERESAMVVAEGTRLYVGEMPVLYLPRLAREITQTHTPIRRIEIGDSGQFGTYGRTQWDLLDLFSTGSADSWAARMSKWGDLTGRFDYYDERGPAAGIDLEYDTPEATGGLFGYYVNDRGTDAYGFAPSSQHRRRAKWWQRTFFGGVQIDTEVSHISDRGFLREYYEREAKEGKEQESYIYAKRTWEHAQASGLYLARLNDFQSQVEYLPEGRFDVLSYPLADGGLLYSSTTTAGNLRFSPDKDLPLSSFQTQRGDTGHLVELPVRIGGGFNVTPFGTTRGTWYDEMANGDSGTRYAASYGAKVGFPDLWRVYDAQNSLLDIHRLRHIATLDFTYENTYDATKRPLELPQFDDVDGIDTRETATVRLRQRLQTRRAAAEAGEPDRTVDLALFEAQADFFPNCRRDNSGRPWSQLRLYGLANVTDDLSVISDGDYDTYDEEFDKAGVWLRVDHSPRTRWAVGSRYVRSISASTLTGQIDHQITDRWEVGILAQYDLDRTGVLDETFVVRRNLHHFVLEISVDYDKGRDDTSIGLKIYPTGIPGLRRFY